MIDTSRTFCLAAARHSAASQGSARAASPLVEERKSMKRTFVLIVSLAFLACGVAGGAFAQETPATETDRIQSLVQPSIAFLQTTYSAPVRTTGPGFKGLLFDGEPVSASGRCTGFFVNPEGYVATAAHCIVPGEDQRGWLLEAAFVRAYNEGFFPSEIFSQEEAAEYAAQYFKVGRLTPSFAVSYPTNSTTISSEETTAARRVGVRVFSEGDIGLLKFEAGGIDFPGLELAEDDEVLVGTPVVAVGFPGSVDDVTDEDYNPSFTGGDVTRIGTTGGRSVAVYQHDAAVSGGMSGGPVVDSDGRVIGVTSFGIVGETEAFNFASPVALLREVLNDEGVENDIGQVGEIYREGVEALYDEKRETALDRFDEVRTFQGNPAVALVNASLYERALALPEESGFPTWLWAVIIAAAILLLVIAGWMLFSRRRATAPRPAVPAYAGVPPAAAPTPLRAESPPAALPPPPPPTPAPAAAPPPAARPAAVTTAAGDGTPALLVVGPRGDTAVRHPLQGDMVIGREAADILVADEQVSRRHAQLSVGSDGKLELSDLGSSNGTEVNGQKVTSPVTLAHGDTIRVGNTDLKVELPPSMRRPVGGETVITPRD